MRKISANRPHRVAVLLLAPVIGFDAAIPSQVFAGAVSAEDEPLYRVTTVGLAGTAPVPTRYGYAMVPEAGPEALAEADTVIVPGTRFPAARYDGRLTEELASAWDRVRPGTRLVSICTGAFVLAAAGVFDGRRATTHWHYAEPFRRLFPQVTLSEDRLFVEDDGVYSSAGLAAGIDLCLHLIRTDHGAEVANRAAREMVVPAWRDGGQAQFIERPIPVQDGPSTGAAREWALAHLGEPIEVADLARRASMSLRTFNRRFREETGGSPGAWLLDQRLEHARHLLESSDLGVEEVARRSGLGTGTTLRQRLRARVGVSPSAYRRAFRSPEGDRSRATG
ncbi:MAG: helix-turn-helix domain-containing protein [Nocardioides sp.]|uniref:GlxA family transcriptional regulator n=1 Tax=Nocardioides sp. TaxID=35761 RepID=UPI0039E46873